MNVLGNQKQANMNMITRLLSLFVVMMSVTPAFAELRIGSICRVKGQEENTLQGMGLVVGLKGTGDADISPTIRALARTMQFMGTPVSKGPKGEDVVAELKNAKNVALVFVTATVPAEGALQGTQIDCAVNAVSAKSLDGGYLLTTPLLGPRPGNPKVYAFAQGPISVDDAMKPTTARIHGGGRLEESIANQFTKDGKFTLVINKSQASFAMAQEIERIINNLPINRRGRSPGESVSLSRQVALDRPIDDGMHKLARAIDQMHVEIRIPSYEMENPVSFISLVLHEPIFDRHSEPRVVVNERTGAIVIGADVEIGPVAVKHKGFVIETAGAPPSIAPWAAVDSSLNNASTTKLKALVDALNALKVPSEDIIDIIKGLERSGDLYGKVIIE